MAKDKSMFTCAFLLALVFSYGVWSTEERQIEADSLPKAPHVSLGSGSGSKVAGEKAFRPTSPGHSPGIGNSFPPLLGSTEERQMEADSLPKVSYSSLGSGSGSGGKVAGEKAFRPTSPGHSPGIRNSFPPLLGNLGN